MRPVYARGQLELLGGGLQLCRLRQTVKPGYLRRFHHGGEDIVCRVKDAESRSVAIDQVLNRSSIPKFFANARLYPVPQALR